MNIFNHELYRGLSQYSSYPFFSEFLDFVIVDKVLQNFLSTIDKDTFMSTKEIERFFNNKKRYFRTDLECEQWEDFLYKYSFQKNHDLLFHDLIGHITLKNNVTSKGEILATAGMCGFSFELGKFYFMNALLIFSLGYKLFDGTRSDYSDISEYMEEINISYNNGKKLRTYLSFNESLLKTSSIEEYLLNNCKKLKEFKI